MVSKLGISFVITGILLGGGLEVGSFLFQRYIDNRVHSALVIDGTSDPDYDDWRLDDADESPLHEKYYFYNLTNYEQILSGTADPVVDEIGPYTFRKLKEKVDVEFSDDNEVVKFKTYSKYEFEKEASFEGADPDRDRFVMPNPAFWALLSAANGSEQLLRQSAVLLALSSIGRSFESDLPLGIRVSSFGGIVQGTFAKLAAAVGGDVYGKQMWAEGTLPDAVKSALPAGFEFVRGSSEKLMDETLVALFSADNKASVVSATGLKMWLASMNDGKTEGIEKAAWVKMVMAGNEIASEAQYAAVAGWIAGFMFNPSFDAIVVGEFKKAVPGNAMMNEVSDIVDLSFLQWATGLPGKINPAIAQATAPASTGKPTPEIGLLCDAGTVTCSGNVRFSVEQSRLLLTGDKSIGTVAGATILQTAVATNKFEDVIATYKLSMDPATLSNQLQTIQAYMGYVTQAYVNAPVQMLTSVAGGAGPISVRSVNEWLFQFDDPLVKLFKPGEENRRSWNTAYLGNISSAEEASLYTQADTIYTGKGDISKRRVYIKYDGESFVGELTNRTWPKKEVISGTDATSFEPKPKKGDGAEVHAFVSNVYRVATLAYKGTDEVKGVPTFSYEVPEKVLAVNVDYDQNIKGVFNLTRMRGVKLYVTKPHRLDADMKRVEGESKPVRADHDFIIEVEPTTGIVIKGNKRLQYNFEMSPTDVTFKNIRTGVIPLFWADQGSEVLDDDAKKLKDINKGLWITFILFIAGFAVGGFFLVFGIAWIVFKKGPDQRPSGRGMEKMVEL